MSDYKADILEQPKALRDTLEFLTGCSFPEEIKDGMLSGRWHRIVLTGMGSSYFALLPLYLRLMEAGIATWLVETSELIYSHGFLNADTLVITASQSGASVETVRLLEITGSQVKIIAITNTEESPLCRQAMYSVVTRAGEEAAVSCKTYLAALAAQFWLGDQFISGNSLFDELKNTPQQVQEYLSGWREHIQSLRTMLEGVGQVYYTGRGASIASAGTAGLTTKEFTHVAAEGMSSAAFRHGPFEMVAAGSFVLVFGGSGQTFALNRKLADDIIKANGRAGLVQRGGKGVFSLPACSDPALPILEMLPVQMMTLALAELHHHPAGSFSLGSKVTITE